MICFSLYTFFENKKRRLENIRRKKLENRNVFLFLLADWWIILVECFKQARYHHPFLIALKIDNIAVYAQANTASQKVGSILIP